MSPAALPFFVSASTSPIGLNHRATGLFESPLRGGSRISSWRSISSMVDLAPLTPTSILTPTPTLTRSPTTVPVWSDSRINKTNLPLAGAMELRLDDSLPEMLVRDLELSKSVFEEKNMTSGAPSPNIKSGCKPVMAYASRLSTSHRTVSSRVQFLDDIEEKSSAASFLDDPETAHHCDETASEVDSSIGTEHSFDACPPPFHMREQSILTNATSLASSGWRPSSKGTRLSKEPRRDSSWIEVDSDEEEVENAEDFHQRDYQRQHQYHGSSRSSHWPVPPLLDGFEVDFGEPRNINNINNLSHRKSFSMSGAESLRSQHQSARSFTESRRRLRKHEISDYQGIVRLRSSSELSSESFPRRQLVQCCTAMSEAPRNDSMLEPSKENQLTEDDDGFMAPLERNICGRRRNAVSTRPSPPVSRQSNAQMQVDDFDYGSGDSHLFMLPLQSDELARIVPLPPDVIETLRVSTLCFPETMLLSSSLTIETIRSYSRKARRPSTEHSQATGNALSTASAGLAAGISCHKSRWRRVVKRGSSFSQKRRGSHGSSSSSLRSSSSATLDAPKPWAAFKNVFNFCSDYICDALYAHIVAYNYVSALVARNPQPPSLSSRQSYSSGPGDKEEIPKKAASLLGFGSSANVAPMRVLSSLAKKSRSAFTTTGQSSNDASLRSIQAELLRCIRQLIATARLMAEDGSGEDRMIEMETQDHDRFLLRSLCEIVRLSEGVI